MENITIDITNTTEIVEEEMSEVTGEDSSSFFQPDMRSRLFAPVEGAIEDIHISNLILDDGTSELSTTFKLNQKIALDVIWFVTLCLFILSSIFVPRMKILNFFDLNIWKWGILFSLITCGAIVHRWTMHAFLYFTKIFFPTYKNFFYFNYLGKNALVTFFWTLSLLITWIILFDHKLRKSTKSKHVSHVTSVLVSLVVGSALWLVKTFAITLLAQSFYKKNYGHVITESEFSRSIIEKLYGGKENFPKIKNESDANKVAVQIIQKLNTDASSQIGIEDLKRFMSEDEAIKTLGVFEGASESGHISKSIFEAMGDAKSAVNKVDKVVSITVVIVTVVISLFVLEIATTKLLLVMSSQLALTAFIFGNTCKTIFESVIFLFVIHPFDVGDRCEVDGVQMIVEELNIMSTVFLNHDNLKMVYPNSLLSTKPISNYNRSLDIEETIQFSIHVSTPQSKVAAMKRKITSYIESKRDFWLPSCVIMSKDIEGVEMVKMEVCLSYRNHKSMKEKRIRRGLLVDEMVKVFKELGINHSHDEQ